ncbi:MAG: cytochrome c [Pseudomonas sp.]|uniref:c-type cytochrome n=1 Tax=Pseudomonas sp. TaxID=306 RepID=UPI00120D98CC|nr:cytochrome c [Pseudomonas sp.]RZI76941.1 MAG: cytochrome c [Pseudomonas sp.]
MLRLMSLTGIALVAGCLMAAPALAGADQVQARIAGFRQVGATYKSVTDGLRAGNLPKVRQAAGQLGGLAHGLYGWFPRGSGPQRGVRTAAKVEIWTRAPQFRAAQDGFARQVQAFARVAAGSDLNVARLEARRLGASCKACHDAFKTAAD